MIVAFLGVSLILLLGCAGLAVDVANGYVVRGILQNAVDDAARTAQRWSTQVDDPGANPETVQVQAVAAALATARRDVRAHGLAAATVVDGVLAGSRLRITARAAVNTWFLRALGVTSWTPAAAAEVVLWTAARRSALPAGAPPGAPLAPPVVPPSSALPPGVVPHEAGSGGADRGPAPGNDAAGPPGNDTAGPPGNDTVGPPGNSPGPAGGGDAAEGL